MVQTTLVCSISQILWQVIFDINNLGHIFHLMAHSLTTMISKMNAASSWSKATNAWRKILILWCLTVALDSIQIELILIWSTTNTSLVYLMRHRLLLSLRRVLLLWHTVHGVIDHICRVTELVVVSSSINVHWVWLGSGDLILTRWRVYLYIVSTSLWTPLDLILNLLGLLLIRFTNWNALTNLLLLGPIQRMHLLMRIHHYSALLIWRVAILLLLLLLHLRGVIHVDVRIIDTSVARIPFRRTRSISSLGCGIALRLPWRFGWTRNTTRGQLLLLHHLTFDLLLMKLLWWSQIKVVNYVRDICYAIIALTISLMRRIDLLATRRQISLVLRNISLILTLEPILHHFPLFVLVTLWLESTRRHDACTLESLVTYTFLTIVSFSTFLIQSLVLIFELDFFFLLLLDVLSSKMLFSLMTLKLVRCKPRINQRLLNINGSHLLLAQFTIAIGLRRWCSNRIRLLFAISALTRLFLFVLWDFLVRTSGFFFNFIRLTSRFLIHIPLIISTITSFLLVPFILVFELLLLLLLLLKALLE